MKLKYALLPAVVFFFALNFSSCGGDDNNIYYLVEDTPEPDSFNLNDLDVTVLTGTSAGIKMTSAIINGFIAYDNSKLEGSPYSVETGICYYINNDFSEALYKLDDTSENETISVQLSGLIPDTRYYYQSYLKITTATQSKTWRGDLAYFETLNSDNVFINVNSDFENFKFYNTGMRYYTCDVELTAQLNLDKILAEDVTVCGFEINGTKYNVGTLNPSSGVFVFSASDLMFTSDEIKNTPFVRIDGRYYQGEENKFKVIWPKY